MSPELEVLDCLSGCDEPLHVIRRLFESQPRFERAILAMLHAGEVRLFVTDGNEVPVWQQQAILSLSHPESGDCVLSITDLGGLRA